MEDVSSLILGKTEIPNDPTGTWMVVAPYEVEQKLARVHYAYSQIDRAIQVSLLGQREWGAHTLEERHRVLCRFAEQLLTQKEELLSELMRESGRPHHDVSLEWATLEQWVREFKQFKAEEQDPRGIVVVLASCVWPLYYGVHFSMMALLAGNAVILKPSEKSTLSTLALASAFKGEGVERVLQMVVGEKEFSRRLACHEKVGAVVFMGSYETGIRLKQDTLHQAQKEVLLYLGSKNSAILAHEHPQEALSQLIEDAFLSAGQNCRSISKIFIPRDRFAGWVELFHEAAKQFKIGAPDSDAWMGPLLEDSMVDRYLKFCGISEREGGTVVMRGKLLSQGKKSNTVTPTLVAFESVSEMQLLKSISLQTEILSPHVSLIGYQDEQELIALANQSHYGHCASVWSTDGAEAQRVAKALEVGEVRINNSTLKLEPNAAFQAKKKSGNHAVHGFAVYHQLGLKKRIG